MHARTHARLHTHTHTHMQTHANIQVHNERPCTQDEHMQEIKTCAPQEAERASSSKYAAHLLVFVPANYFSHSTSFLPASCASNQNNPLRCCVVCLKALRLILFGLINSVYGKCQLKVKLLAFVAFLHLTGDEFLHTEAPASWVPSHKLAAKPGDKM